MTYSYLLLLAVAWLAASHGWVGGFGGALFVLSDGLIALGAGPALAGIGNWNLPIFLGLIVAVSVHIIGALLVLALLVTPAAAAMRVAHGPIAVPLLAAGFGIVSAVGGILLAIAGTLPVSPYITTISFVIYLVCRVVGSRRGRVRTLAAR